MVSSQMCYLFRAGILTDGAVRPAWASGILLLKPQQRLRFIHMLDVKTINLSISVHLGLRRLNSAFKGRKRISLPPARGPTPSLTAPVRGKYISL